MRERERERTREREREREREGLLSFLYIALKFAKQHKQQQYNKNSIKV